MNISTQIAVSCICLFVILPLTLVGTVLGRNLSGTPDHPCRVNAVPRPIPEKKWFMEPLAIVMLGGILPFGSIFIEMYFIFTSFWAYKIYYVYGFMLLVLMILAVVTVCVTIVCTYFLLNAEDYRWCVGCCPVPCNIHPLRRFQAVDQLPGRRVNVDLRVFLLVLLLLLQD